MRAAVEAANDVVELPQGPFRTVLAPVSAQLSHDYALGRALQGQGAQNALDVRPLRHDQPLPRATDSLDQPVLVVVPRMAKPVDFDPLSIMVKYAGG